MTRRSNCLTALALVSAAIVAPQVHAQLMPVSPGGGLVGPGNAMGDQAGSAVSIDGTSAVVGARYDDDMGDSSGTASVFRFNGSTWVHDGQLIATDGAAYDQFGASVAVSGIWALVGAPMFEDVSVSPYPDIGAVYVFKRTNGVWQQTQRLFSTNPRTNDQFGLAIAMSGTAAVCSTTKDAGGTLQGAAYVYRLNGSTWTMEQKLTAAAGGTYTYGASVAIQGNRVAVGASNETNNGILFSGAAYVYDFNGSTWQQKQRLVPTDAAASDSFGFSVAVDNDTIAIGATGDDDRGSNSGSVYLFKLNGSTWTQSQKLLAIDGTASDLFGWCASMSQGLLLVGAKDKYGPPLYTGAAYAFRKLSTTYSFENRLVLPTVTSSDYFGAAVSAAGNIAIVGNPGSDFSTFNGGRAWLYSSGSAPNTAPILTVSSPVNNSSYTQGQSVSFSASASDAEDGNLTADIDWTSSIQGSIGSGGSFTLTTLQVGTHTITASVTDSGGESDTVNRTVTINATANTAPSLTVNSPANNSTFGTGQSVSFSASATDAQDGNLTSSIQWTSNLQVPSLIGTGGSFSKSNLVVGVHTITIKVTDSGGLSDTKTRTVTITASNTAPVVTIFSPANNSSYVYGASVSFSATASDVQDGNLTGSIVWTSSLQGQIGTGGAFTKNNLVAGTHTITASVFDNGGLQGTAFRTITITAPPTNTPPTVTISSPSNSHAAYFGTPITFSGSASDVQDGNISSALVWTSNLQGQIGLGASFTYSTLQIGTHIITARVTDSGGLQGTATRTVIINPPLAPPVDTGASSQIAVSGTVTGSYTNTQTVNLVYQDIKEQTTSGNPSNRYTFLEHKWVITNVPTGGTTRSFHLKAYKLPQSPGDGDNFVFAYSTNNSTWTDMLTVTQTADSGTYQVFTLPPTLSGTVYIRVKDTVQTPGTKVEDTIRVDHLFIRKQ